MSATVTPEMLAHWQQWIGKTETRTETLCPETLRRFAAATDAALEVESVLPALAHWAYFLPLATSGDIGPDGHPKRGGFVPPITLPRRMFAAADITIAAPLQLELPAHMHAEITDLKHRSGGSGELILMDVVRTISQRGAICVQEKQTIVFRQAGAKTPPVVPVARAPQPDEELWVPGHVDLFRFSSVTFNSHRIHYDTPYATNEEGYPDLVVHGPFTAVKLFSYAQKQLGAPLKHFSFRAVAPLFVGQSILLCRGAREGEFKAMRCDGVDAMTAVASTGHPISGP
jgi:3-methylfumaryl-CoA hydratase